jgi:hypothetical protein
VIFPLPNADAAFIARWTRKVQRANEIWVRAWERSDFLAAHRAHVLLCQLNDLRDAIVAAAR